jgi:hypothetical protein
MIFDIKQSEESLTSHSGLALIGALLNKTNLDERLNAVFLPDHPRPDISHGTIAKSMIGLLCLGKPDFEAIEAFRADPFFSTSLEVTPVPSEGTLRQRLNDAEGALDAILKEESAEMIKRHAPRLSPCYKKYVPLDLDVSPFDNSGTKKEGVSWTYKKVDGYAPMLAYLGEEGYWINAELREGKQHCQNGTPEFLRETIGLAKRITTSPLLVRLDSGNDSLDNIQVCLDEKVDWLIKRNRRQESVEMWLEIAKTVGTLHVPRLGKVVYRGDLEVTREGVEKPLRQVFEVTVRTIDRQGQELLLPEIEVETYETSLPDAPATIVELYHAHGTSEQFHSEIKSDMDLERLPSGKFSTNAVVLLLGMVAYNCLRLCGQESLREEGIPQDEQAPIRKQVSRRRLRSVMQDLIYMASRVVTHARQAGMAFGRWNSWYPVWKRVYQRFVGAYG